MFTVLRITGVNEANVTTLEDMCTGVHTDNQVSEKYQYLDV